MVVHVVAAGAHDAGQNVDGDREDDGGVVLGGDAVEGLQVAQLQRRGTVRNHLRRVPERPARLVLALGRDNLGPGLPGSLGLGSHGPHELLGHPDILQLNPLHGDAPGVRGHVQCFLDIISFFRTTSEQQEFSRSFCANKYSCLFTYLGLN